MPCGLSFAKLAPEESGASVCFGPSAVLLPLRSAATAVQLASCLAML